MLFFKSIKAVKQQQNFYIKEIYYKLYKLFVIFFKLYNLANILILKKKGIYYKNICIISNKAKSINRKLKVSRIIIRELSNLGFFFGLQKLSW